MTPFYALLAIAALTLVVCWLFDRSPIGEEVFGLFWGWCIIAGLAAVLSGYERWPALVVCALTPPLVVMAHGIFGIWWSLRLQRMDR